MTFRDLYLGVRAQNLAGGVIRGVGRDLRMQMQQVQMLGTQKMQVASALKHAQLRKQELNDRVAELSSGQKINAIRAQGNKLIAEENELTTKRNAAAKVYSTEQTALNDLMAKAPLLKNKKAIASLNAEIATQRAVVTQARDAFLEYDAALNKNNASVSKNVAMQNKYAASLARTQQAVVLAAEDEDLLLRKQTLVNDALMRAQTIGMKQALTRTVEHAGRTAFLGGAVGLLAAGGAARSAADYQTAAALAATQARPLGKGPATTMRIQNQIMADGLKLMKQYPASSKEMQDAYYQIFSSTNIQKPAQATKMLEVFNKMAVAGGASLEDMTKAGIVIYNNFPNEFKNMTEAANVFFAAVRYGYTNASALANVLGYINPIAAEAGMTFRQTAADLAFMTRQTGPRMIRQDAQGLARLIQLFGRDDVTKGLAGKGIQVFDKVTHKMRSLVDIIGEIHTKLKLTPQEMLNFFKMISAAGSGKSGTSGTIQAIRIFANGYKHIKAYHDVFRNVNKDAHEFEQSYNIMSKQPSVRWQIFVNQLKEAVIVVGQGAIPAFMKLGTIIQRLIGWWDSLSETTRRHIGYLLVMTSALFFLGGALAMVGGGIASFIIGLKLWKIEAALTSATMTEAGVSAANAGGMFGRFGALVGLGFKKASAEEGGFNFAGLRAMGILGSIAGALILLRGNIFSVGSAFSNLSGILNAGLLAFTAASIFRVASAAIVAAGEVGALGAALAGLPELIPIVISIAVITHMGLGKVIKDAVKGVYHQVVNDAKSVANAAGDTASSVTRAVGGWFGMDKPATRKQIQEAKDHMALLGKVYGPELVAAIEKKMGGKVPDFKNLFGHHPTEKEIGAFNAWYNQLWGNLTPAQRKDVRQGLVPESKLWENFNKRITQADARIRGAVRAAKDLGVAPTASFQRLFNNLKNATEAFDKAKKALAGKPSDQKALAAYFSASANLSKADAAMSEGVQKQKADAARKAIAAILKAQNDALKAGNDAANSALDEYKQKLDQASQTLSQVYTTGLQNLKEQYGTLFTFQGTTPMEKFKNDMVQSKIDWGIPLSTQDLEDNLNMQNAHFDRWRKALTSLAGKLPHDMLLAIQTQGEAATPFAEALLRATPAQRADLIKKWKHGQHAIQVAARQDFNREMKHWNELGKKIVDNMLQGMDEESAKIHDWIQNLAKTALADLGITPSNPKGDAGLTSGSKGGANGVIPGSQVIHVNVTHKGDKEDASKAAQKAAFHLKNALW